MVARSWFVFFFKPDPQTFLVICFWMFQPSTATPTQRPGRPGEAVRLAAAAAAKPAGQLVPTQRRAGGRGHRRGGEWCGEVASKRKMLCKKSRFRKRRDEVVSFVRNFLLE